jgi:hypothetical protein
VETLVAIAVLMIAVAGPLVIASKGLTAALYARDQMIASLLAQESMEKIKNLRYNNIANIETGGRSWLYGMSSCILDSDLICDADALGDDDDGITSYCPLGYQCGVADQGFPLFFSPEDGYGTDPDRGSGTTETLFRRYFFLHSSSGSPILDTVTVVVSWNQGLVSNEVRLISELSDSVR